MVCLTIKVEHVHRPKLPIFWNFRLPHIMLKTKKIGFAGQFLRIIWEINVE